MADDSPSVLRGNFPSRFRVAASALMERLSLSSYAGITHGGRRDIFDACGYDRSITLRQYRDRYNRGDVASRVVEAYPEATWRGTGENFVYDDDDPQVETPFEKAWNDLNRRLRIWSALQRVDILAGLGHYAVMLIGGTGKYNEPLPTALGPHGIVFVQPFCQEDAPITRYEEDTTNPRYGQPLEYTLRRTATVRRGTEFTRVPMGEQFSRTVHWTRIIHVAEGALDDEVFGKPRLERVWNRLDDLDKVAGAGSEAFWQRAHQGFQLDADKDIEFDEAEVAKLNEQVDDFVHGLRRFVKTRGTKMSMFGSDVAKFETNVASLISLISATTKIPQRLLMGSERGELASTEDRHNWQERVQDRRTRFAEPVVLRPLIERLVRHGALPMPERKKADAQQDQKSRLSDEHRGERTKLDETTEKPIAGKPAGKPPFAAAPRAALVPFAKVVATTPPMMPGRDVPTVQGQLVDDDAFIDFAVFWPEVLDVPRLERLEQAKIAMELGATIITHAEIRDEYLGMEPMSEEDLAAAEASKLQEQNAEIEKAAARGTPFGKPAGGDVKPGVPIAPGADATGKPFGKPRAAAESEHTGLWVYLKLDDDAARTLALDGPGAESPDALHVTVAYCDGSFDAAVSALAGVAEQSAMMYGTINGIGTFAPSPQSDGRTVLWARPDVDGLAELHERVLSALSVVGIRQRTEREYLPHVTLAYVEPGAEIRLPIVERVPLYFSKLCVGQGDQYAEFWFGQAPTAPTTGGYR